MLQHSSWRRISYSFFYSVILSLAFRPLSLLIGRLCTQGSSEFYWPYVSILHLVLFRTYSCMIMSSSRSFHRSCFLWWMRSCEKEKGLNSNQACPQSKYDSTQKMHQSHVGFGAFFYSVACSNSKCSFKVDWISASSASSIM